VIKPKTSQDLSDILLSKVNSIPRKGNTCDAIDDDLTVVLLLDEKVKPAVSKRFSKKLDVESYKKENIRCTRESLYPDKETLTTEKNTYLVEMSMVSTPDYSAKLLSGNLVLVQHTKKDYPKLSPETLLSGKVHTLSLRPVDAFVKKGSIYYIAPIHPGMMPISVSLTSRKRTEQELTSIANVFLDSIESLHGTPYEPIAYDPNRILMNINDEILFDVFLEQFNTNIKNNPVDVAASVIRTLYFIFSGSQKNSKTNETSQFILSGETEDRVTKIFGIEDKIAIKDRPVNVAQTVSKDSTPISIQDDSDQNQSDGVSRNVSSSKDSDTAKSDTESSTTNADSDLGGTQKSNKSGLLSSLKKESSSSEQDGTISDSDGETEKRSIFGGLFKSKKSDK
jgi:hypothetical protein